MAVSPSLPSKQKRSWWAGNWKALLAVWAISLLPFLPVLLSGKALFASDQMGAPGAWRWYFEALRSGTIPLWNPYSFGGMPTFDAMFGDSAYPPFLLLGFLLPVTHVVTWNYVLHVLIAGFTAYFLAQRYFRLSPWLAAPLAVAWALNPNAMGYLFGGHTAKFFIMAWLPLGLFFLLRSLGPTASWKHALGLALTTALCVLTTHLQFTYFVLMGYFLVWLFQVVPALRRGRLAEAGSLALRFWVPALLGIGLAFFIFYPPVQYNKDYSVRGGAERTTYEHATSWSMHPEETASLLIPEFGGLNENYWGRNPFKLNTEAPGTLVWFLGLLSLFAFRKSRWSWLWATAGLIAIVYGLGAHTPVFRLFYEFVPGVKNFRAPSMMLFWLSMALFLLSAEALRRLTAEGPDRIADADREKIRRRLTRVGWITAGVLALAGLAPGAVYGLWGVFVDESLVSNIARQPHAQSAFALGAFRAAALVAVLTWATSRFLLAARRPAALGLVALAVVVVDLYWLDSHFIKGYDAKASWNAEPAVRYLQSDTSRFRVFGLPGSFDRWQLQYYGVESTDGFIDHELNLYREFRGGDYQRNPNFFAGLEQAEDGTVGGNAFLDLLNVKYLAFRPREAPSLQLVPNRTYLPRAFFASAWEVVEPGTALERMTAPGFDPRRAALIEGVDETSGGTPRDPSTPVPAAREVRREPNRLEYVVTAPAPGYLVIGDVWFPHWRATVNGEARPVARAYHALRAVKVDAGENTVVLEYSSPWIRRGFAVAGLSLALLAGTCALFAAAERRRGRAHAA